VLNPGQSFNKTWRIQNTGGCTWSNYSFVFTSGVQMNGPSSTAVSTTAPGQTVDVTVPLVAPQVGGTYQGFWQLENTQGVVVAGGPFWALISIPFTGGPPTGGGGNGYSVNVNAPTVVTPGQKFQPQVTVTIPSGQLLQSRGDMLRNTDGNLYGAWPLVAVVGTVNPGAPYTFTFYPDHPITAPSTEGNYASTWQLWENGTWVGPTIPIAFTVKIGGGTRPNTPTPTSPSNWAEQRDGSTPQLCATTSSGNVQYDFQFHDSAQTPDSGWISGNCWTPPTLGPYTFTWHVKVRDNSSGLESGWSDDWHFTIDSQQLTLDPISFYPASPSAADDSVQVRSCVQGFGNVNLGLSYDINSANDGSSNGEWHGFSNHGENCPPINDPSQWGSMPSRDYTDGDHLVRATGYGPQGQTLMVYAIYHFNHRRPQGVQLLGAVYLAPIRKRSNVRTDHQCEP
jgi:Ig-like domain-containing protein